jgi:hypothetical protein
MVAEYFEERLMISGDYQFWATQNEDAQLF